MFLSKLEKKSRKQLSRRKNLRITVGKLYRQSCSRSIHTQEKYNRFLFLSKFKLNS